MILIKNAKLVSLEIKDVLIKDGKIESIEDSIEISENIRIIDAQKSFLLPGLVDLNVRLANSQLNSNSLKKLTKTSLHGGVTTSVIMPDFSPRLDNSTLLEHFKIKAEKEECDLHVAAPLSNEEDERLNNIATLLNNGATAIWTPSSSNTNVLKRGFQYARMKKAPIFCKCYDADLDDNGVMNEGEVSFRLGLGGISKVSENSEVAKIAEISLINNTKIIFQSLSTKRSISILKEMKKINKNIYREISIHHLCKNENSCDGFNTYAKIMPPLREESERVAMLSELVLGNIDALTSLHSPKSVTYKDVAFDDAAFGIGCIEEYLSLCYTHLVKSEMISMDRLLTLCSLNPAHIIDRDDIGKVEVGYKADLVIFDEKVSKIINDKSSLYNGDTLFGEVKKVLKDGVIVES
ncbi:amidohydrolase family protein [Sulfurospirillum arcachonense]|uniref:amidohydrolase family protein n=1 Tax=Sulfurospirillum arcachonense TaxID=57666 RepID=UPI0004AC6615|nr:amidohydrolase family protein [Sulfurospirillum arcachonense]